MKRYMLWCLLFLLMLGGCSAKKPSEEAAKTETAVPSHEETAFTEQDILDIFHGYAYADPSDRVVVDCVVMEESSCGVIGVVQYITDDYDGCWFDFLREQEKPITAGVQALPQKNTLSASGTDSVTCRMLLDENTEASTFCITYYEEDIETGFRIESVGKGE